MFKALVRSIYGVYATATFVIVILLLFCPLLICLPTLNLRRAVGRAAVRTWLASILVPFRVEGLELLPKGPCIALCNHASYVDGILFTAALPARFTFLVQHRAAAWPYVGLIIRRMGVSFVNRESPLEAGLVASSLTDRVRRGMSLAIFPEGTFVEAAGLLPFYRGAFVIAEHALVPIAPAVMLGTRQFFGENQRMPRWSSLKVRILPTIPRRIYDAESMRTQAWNIMKAHCGE